MKLVKRLIEVATVVFVISLFMNNKDVYVTIQYFGLVGPIKLAFWELVTIAVSLGIIIAAIGDSVAHLKWASERKRLTKEAKESKQTAEELKKRIDELESEIVGFKARGLEDRAPYGVDRPRPLESPLGKAEPEAETDSSESESDKESAEKTTIS